MRLKVILFPGVASLTVLIVLGLRLCVLSSVNTCCVEVQVARTRATMPAILPNGPAHRPVQDRKTRMLFIASVVGIFATMFM